MVAEETTESSERKTVVIDVGHGGKDSGAVCQHNGKQYTEYELNVMNANTLAAELREQGFKVVLTNDPTYREARRGDFRGRRDVALAVEADLYISMHANANRDQTARGTWVCVDPRAHQSSRNFADVVRGNLNNELGTGVLNRNYELEAGHRGPTRLMNKTGIPTILIETGFMSNPRDMDMMLDEQWARNMAGSIAKSSRQFIDNPETKIEYDYSIARGTREYGGRLLSVNTYNKKDATNLQSALGAMGYEVGQEGVFDKKTADAVKAFQKAHGLQIDGIVGPETFGKLNEIAQEMKIGQDIEFQRTNLKSSDLAAVSKVFEKFDIGESAEYQKARGLNAPSENFRQ